MALKFKAAPMATVTEQKSKSGVAGPETAKEVPVPGMENAFITGAAVFGMVGMEAARTINLGNYESVKLGVVLHLPCHSDPASVEAAFKIVRDFVENTLGEMVEEV